MLKKKIDNQGYILLESCLAFMLVTVLLIEIIPLVVSLKQFQREGQQRLEVYRYFSELALDYQVYGELELGEKVSNQTVIRADGNYSTMRVESIKLEVGEQIYTIQWLGGTASEQVK